jgi:MFS transporter, DHA1 family, multidrug resistance protein
MKRMQNNLSQAEFIALVAMMFATVAFSIDAMLPALPEIAQELTPRDPNRAQLILTSFVLGMGIGTFFAGPLSDSFGRKRVIVWGGVLYCLGAALAWAAPTLELVLLGRVVQGLGAAAPRIVTMAMVRDLHSGRAMARIMSFAMMVFTLVPAVAPLIGAQIMAFTGWRGIFGAFLVFSVLSIGWVTLRQPETLAPDHRRPFRLAPLAAATREVLTTRVVVVAILIQSALFGMLFGALSQIQPLFSQTFGKGDSFPLWFALIALLSAPASLLNATFVLRLGMRRILGLSLGGVAVFSGVMAAVFWAGILPPSLAFAGFFLWVTGLFFSVGLTLGNLNALAMEPMGHIAGLAASVISAIATVVGVGLAVPLGLAFDGTAQPIALGAAILSMLAWVLLQTMPRRG